MQKSKPRIVKAVRGFLFDLRRSTIENTTYVLYTLKNFKDEREIVFNFLTRLNVSQIRLVHYGRFNNGGIQMDELQDSKKINTTKTNYIFNYSLSIIAILISLSAIYISRKNSPNHFHEKGLQSYNLTSPEETIKSMHQIISNHDLLAGLELIGSMIKRENIPEAKLFFTEKPEIKIEKSIEVKNSGNETNNGTIISFVKTIVDGVEYHFVMYFDKDSSGKFYPQIAYIKPWDPAKMTDEDKSIDGMINKWQKEGKL
jgi:hypothetical protein